MKALALLLLGCAGLEAPPRPDPYEAPPGCAWRVSTVLEPGQLLLICETDGGRLVVRDRRPSR